MVRNAEVTGVSHKKLGQKNVTLKMVNGASWLTTE